MTFGSPAASLEEALLTACDREPIHRPDAIQPHGILLVADQALIIRGGAGAIEDVLQPTWLGQSLASVLGLDQPLDPDTLAITLGSITVRTRTDREWTASCLTSGACFLIELEPVAPERMSARAVLAQIDECATQFERCADIQPICHLAAENFRRLTGFDRVMVYRFAEDGSGEVLAEARDDAMPSLINHHFPSTDIPHQARALYLRNRIRTIPDVDYIPAPLRPENDGLSGLDMSDAALRSVSPIHIQYLKNMGVGASASVSIVIDGMLWGLIACHHRTPHFMDEGTRNACSMLAGVLSRQLRGKEELLTYQERLRIRNAVEALDTRIDLSLSSLKMIENVADDLRLVFPTDGFAIVSEEEVLCQRECPSPADLRKLVKWIATHNESGIFATHALSSVYPPADDFPDRTAGVLAINLPFPKPIMLLWLRAEIVEVLKWAGHPHKNIPTDPNEMLRPRQSFETWRETVRGLAPRWDSEQVQGARRLRRHLIAHNQNQQLRELNNSLNASLRERDSLIQQKDFLIREVNHRVQNSLQLVASFLKLQARASNNEETALSLAEAQRRIAAIGLVHRRLYRDDHLGTIDLSRYLDELCDELCSSIGPEWRRKLTLSMMPVMISADRAINIGLIVTELVINISKYAYGGQSGPIDINMKQVQNRLTLSVSDSGVAMADAERNGFGTRMMRAIVGSLSGTLNYDPLYPGLRATLMIPVETGTDPLRH
ncbi:histidine kinase [Neoasaia chiangmaiensis]|uniref:Histidine kinase n=2 Tax=Neoasaia chiangmaiensis TaxID=320497 RepID=A0A1U9KSQ6_9PROT|nr:histidine kinase dimerization/phosphoacceptor domain -containing protein [Neoasaia chiangmaiensis]AQS88863.1 histidine kinase [Neoasaia chiangmaiensis]